MKNSLLFCFWIFFGLLAHGQTQSRLVTGRLTNDNKEALVGVSITIKGTSTGTVSDVDGRYKLVAPLGATLVFSYIGMLPREMVVTEKNSRPSTLPLPAFTPSSTEPAPAAPTVQPAPVPPVSDESAPAVAVVQDHTPGFAITGQMPLSAPYSRRRQVSYPLTLPRAYSIRYARGWWARLYYGAQTRDGLYILDTRPIVSLPLQVTFHSIVSIDQINRLPALQNQYAQGRPQDGAYVWRGAETGEPFSWGPRVTSLEFSGLPYTYDANGSLVPRGTGNGVAARTYDPYAFFRTGYTLENSLHIHTEVRKTEIGAGVSQYTQQAVLPHSRLTRTQADLRLQRPIGYYLTLKGTVFYTNTDHALPNRSGNWARLMAAALLTPPTFDNAYNQTHTYATGNPYALAAQVPDADHTRKLLASLSASYQRNRFEVGMSGNTEYNQQHTVFGLPPTVTTPAQSRLTERRQTHSLSQYRLVPAYTFYVHKLEVKAEMAYQLGYQQNRMQRDDALGFAADRPFQPAYADWVYHRQATHTRLTQEITPRMQLSYRNRLFLNLANQAYTSSTLVQNAWGLPSAGLAFRFSEWSFLKKLSFLTNGRLYTNFSSQVQEAPLVYTQWAYNSTLHAAADFSTYTENQEITQRQPARPEHIRKWEAGTEIGLFHNKLSLSVTHFRNLTQQALVPVVQNGVFRLDNLADIRNTGMDASIRFQNFVHKEFHIYTKLTFSRARPVVTDVYGADTRLPIAGFADVSMNVMKGQPYGVLVGSRWKRTTTGQMVIGSDGYPLVDTEPGVIGNPNPQWTAGLSNTLKWRDWQLLCVWDFRRGGDVWNGTQQVLDYYGLSQRTQLQRETRTYIFDGVLENGQRNSIPVDFTNPANGLSGNRWVRYGATGVAEDAIQDASWVRLSELKISYALSGVTRKGYIYPRVTVALFGKNLWMHTPYTGVDPAAALFGYASATGLDLFNAPSVRSYGLSVHVVF